MFSPEHGFQGTADRPDLPDGLDSATGVPIYSLYRSSRPPKWAALDSLDVVLVDLQDIGARYYTYISTTVMLMDEAARRGRAVVILDRPNPLGGAVVQGNVRDSVAPVDVFVGFLPLPMRHGLTLGEMARLANDVLGIGAELTVVPAAGWRREQYFDATGLPWVRPSPNMPSLESAMHYPGVCLFEGTNVSVGRGTADAFQLVGAPWVDPAAVLRRLEATPQALAGVAVAADSFTPRDPGDAKYHGVVVRGVRLRVTDRTRYDPTRTAVALLAAIRAAHRDSLTFRDRGFDRLAAGSALREAVVAGAAPERIWAAWEPGLTRFRRERTRYLLY